LRKALVVMLVIGLMVINSSICLAEWLVASNQTFDKAQSVNATNAALAKEKSRPSTNSISTTKQISSIADNNESRPTTGLMRKSIVDSGISIKTINNKKLVFGEGWI